MINRVLLHVSALDIMTADVTAFGPVETGGILAGYRDGDDLVVCNATTGGPKATREPRLFVRDVEYCQEQLDALYSLSGGRVDYVGEWHRHCSRSTAYSRVDEASLRVIASSSEYNQPDPVMVIIGVPDAARIEERQVTAWILAEEDEDGERQVVEAPIEVIYDAAARERVNAALSARYHEGRAL